MLTGSDAEHVCHDGSVVSDVAAPVATNEHGDAWCAACGERLLLPGHAGGPALDADDESNDPRQHAVVMLLQYRDDPSNVNAASLIDGILAAARRDRWQ